MTKETGLSLDTGNIDELNDFVLAMEEKIKLAEEKQHPCFVHVYDRIKHDMKQQIRFFEDASVSFQKAYLEITSLHVFAEMYLKLDS